MQTPANFFQNKFLTDVLTYMQSALQVLLFAVVVMCLGVAWWRYQSTVFVSSEIKFDAKSPSADSSPLLSKTTQPLNFYTDLVGQRDIFRHSSVTSAVSVEIPDATAQANQDLITRYVVQGIVYDRNPMAIIKDVQNNKTYFLHRNEILEGQGAKLIDIRENRVIFDRDGQPLELIKK